MHFLEMGEAMRIIFPALSTLQEANSLDPSTRSFKPLWEMFATQQASTTNSYHE